MVILMVCTLILSIKAKKIRTSLFLVNIASESLRALSSLIHALIFIMADYHFMAVAILSIGRS